jgi:hypothetical protein
MMVMSEIEDIISNEIRRTKEGEEAAVRIMVEEKENDGKEETEDPGVEKEMRLAAGG